jgi:hypothetical protein
MARQPLFGCLGLLIFRGFTITLFRHTTVGRTPLDEWPARRRDLYLTTHSTHKRQTSMPTVGFEPTILVSERPQTHTLDRRPLGSANETSALANVLDKLAVFSSSVVFDRDANDSHFVFETLVDFTLQSNEQDKVVLSCSWVTFSGWP